MNYETFCAEWLKSWTGNQPEKLLVYYTADAFYSDPANVSGLKGHEQLLPYFSKLLKYNPYWVWTAQEIMPTEKGFTLKWKAVIPVKDNTLTIYGLDIVEVLEGKINRNEVYFDRTEWLKALQF
jgi:hypothetical protein